jgi:anti-anti-sigma factor
MTQQVKTLRTDDTGGGTEVRGAWSGEVTWRETSALREALFDLLESPGPPTVHLDVCEVTTIDTTGLALLIGANHRAHGLGRSLVLVDRGGAVTRGLTRIRMIDDFSVVQVLSD